MTHVKRLGDVGRGKLEADFREGRGGGRRGIGVEVAEAAIVTTSRQHVIENVSDEKSFFVVE